MSAAPTFLTSFVGRERELGELGRLVARCRLVTLTGAPGAGKSRLAAEAVRGWRGRFGEQSWMDLAGVEDPKSLAPLVADALGIRSREGGKLLAQTAGPLSDRRALLVLDSCESLAAACARVVARIISLLPSLHVLATSQEPLGIGGERLFLLSPLDPEAAVRLFVERAEARQHGFAAADHSRREIATLCRHLDNLPLAIELAAGRSHLMTAGEMLSHLNERFEVLVGSSREGPPHHRTLQASIEASYRLLEPEDRSLLNRLSMCAGSFDLPIASALSGQRAMDGVGRLVDRSLIVATREREVTRYRLLESIREFALRRLAEDGALEDARCHLHEHLLADAEAGYQQRMRDGSDELLLLLADNRENLHALLDQLQPTDPAAALRLAGAMREDMALRTPLEGRQRLARLIGTHPPRDRWLARGLLALGHVKMVLGNAAEANQALLDSSAISREIDDLLGEAWALYFAGNTDVLDGDAASGGRYLAEALELFGRTNSPYGLVRARTSPGMALVIQGEDLQRARRLLEEASKTGERMGNRWSVGIAALYLGLLELRLGRPKEAAECWRRALTTLCCDDGALAPRVGRDASRLRLRAVQASC